MVTATERHRSPGSDARRVGLLSHALHLEQKEMNTEIETGQSNGVPLRYTLTLTLTFIPTIIILLSLLVTIHLPLLLSLLTSYHYSELLPEFSMSVYFKVKKF